MMRLFIFREPVDEENLKAIVSHSKSDDLSMIEDLLDTKFNQLKMNSSTGTLTVPSNTPLGENHSKNPLDVMTIMGLDSLKLDE